MSATKTTFLDPLSRLQRLFLKYAIGKRNAASVIHADSEGALIYIPAVGAPWATPSLATLGPRSWRVTWRSNNTSSSPPTPKDSTSAAQPDLPALDTESSLPPSPQSSSPSSSAEAIQVSPSYTDGILTTASVGYEPSTEPSMSSVDSGILTHTSGSARDV